MKLNGTLILILVVALAAISGVAWTQNMNRAVCPLTGEAPICTGDGPGPHGLMGPYHRPDRMAAALDLDIEQREAMREIMTTAREANRERMETALAGILTPEQLNQLDQIMAQGGPHGAMGRSGGQGRMGGGQADRPARRLERMTANLDLTPAQQQEILLILEEAAPAPGVETRDKVRAVLTPEQQAQMDQQCQQRTPGMGQSTRPGMGQGAGPGMKPGRGGRGMGRNTYARGPAGQGMGPGQGVGLPGNLANQLQLTDAQREAVRELMNEIRSEQRIETRSRIEALLTPEQLEKLEQLHQD